MNEWTWMQVELLQFNQDNYKLLLKLILTQLPKLELDFEDMSISNKTDDEESDISLMKAEHRTIIPGTFFD